MGDQEPGFLHVGDDHFARDEAVQPQVLCRHQTIGGLDHAGFGIEHVKHVGRLDPGALAHFKVIEVMPRGDLDHARAEFGIGVLVRHHLEAAAGDRLEDFLANDRLVALVVRVHRHGHVGQHGFGARRGHLDMARAIGKWIAEAPEAALDLVGLDLKVRDRGLQLRVPVDQPLVAVDQPAVVEIDENLHHGAGEVRVHRELLAAPVHRAAQAAQLAGDRAAAFSLPFPDLVDEGLARIVGALVLPRFQLAFDDHLRGDPGVVGADHPQCILAAQPLIADHHVLQRVVERMADMQAARYVGRRVDDGKGLRVGPFRAEQAIAFPMLVPLRLDRGGVESLGEFGIGGRFGHRSGPLPAPASPRKARSAAIWPAFPCRGGFFPAP